jgi:hypothetical protein
VDITDQPHLDTPPSTVQLVLPPLPALLGCELNTDTYHNLPYISKFLPDTPLATSLLLHGLHNSSFWILSLNSNEFITAGAVFQYLTSIRHATNTIYIPCILARCIASTRTSLAGSRILFNQIRLISEPQPSPPVITSPSTFVPVGCKVVSSPTRPDTPKNFGQTL